MSFNGKARSIRTFEKITRDHATSIQLLHNLVNRKHTPSVTNSIIIKGQAASIGSIGAGRLKTAGDTMIGPIAINPVVDVPIGTGNVLDISQNNGNYSSYIKLAPAVGAVIKTIKGAAFNGQQLWLQAQGGPYTIDNTGNINPLNAEPTFTWQDNDFIILIFDFTSERWVQVTAPGAGGMQNPATADLDMNNFSIIGLDKLKFNVVSQTLAAGDRGIVGTTNGLKFNIPNLKQYEFYINNVLALVLAATTVDFRSHNIINLHNIGFDTVGNSINSDASGIHNNIGSGEFFDWLINGFQTMVLDNTALMLNRDLDLNTDDVKNCDDVFFSAGGFNIPGSRQIFGDGAGVHINVPLGGHHKLFVNANNLSNPKVDYDFGAGICTYYFLVQSFAASISDTAPFQIAKLVAGSPVTLYCPDSIDLGTNATKIRIIPAGLQHFSSVDYQFRSVSANYTLGDSDHILKVDSSGGTRTITLPSAAGIAGREYVIFKSAAANNVVVNAAGGQTINGSASATLISQYTALRLVSDGVSQWMIQ